MMKKLLPFFTAIQILVSCNGQVNAQAINADEFEKQLANKEVQLLDVRTKGEFNSGYIANALQADWSNAKEFDRRISFINKEKPVYVYCLAGGRSAAAAAKLRKEGFKNVVELKGGINAWKAANKKLIGVSTATQMSLTDYNTAIAKDNLVLVDFGATWCPPCKQMEPILADIQQKKGKLFTLFKVDGGKDEEVLKANNVTALPVFIVYKNGKQIWRKDGVCTREELIAVLK